MNNNFKFNYVLNCNDCEVFDQCPAAEEGQSCKWEEEDYEDMLSALKDEYALNRSSLLVAEQLIANMFVAKRAMRELKFNGLTKQVVTEDGRTIVVENPVKQGMHLEFNRIIRLFKELKMTPKEKAPTTRKVETKSMIMNIVKGLNEDENFTTVGGIPATVKRKREVSE